MPSLARRLGVLVLTGAALAGCMSGRSSLLATEEARGDVANAPDPPLAPIGGAYPVGPSRTLAASNNSVRASAIGRSAGLASTTPVSVRASTSLAAPTVGTLRVSSALAANTGAISTRGGVGVALTPTLAPASTVGASVAAVSEPLNAAVSVRTRTRVGSRTTVHAAVKVKTPVIGATVRVGG
jgi:hypothetical protein